MIRKIQVLLKVLLLILFLSITSISVFAESSENFEIYMQEWESKRELATKYLLEAEDSLRSGDELSGCANQKKASHFGIEATEALIKAMEINGSMKKMDDLESGLKKWKELGDFC